MIMVLGPHKKKTEAMAEAREAQAARKAERQVRSPGGGRAGRRGSRGRARPSRRADGAADVAERPRAPSRNQNQDLTLPRAGAHGAGGSAS